MNKQDMLFIRACKSNHAVRRVKRLYKMFYLCPSDTIQTIDLVQILAGVCDRNLPKITYAKAVDMSKQSQRDFVLGIEKKDHYEVWFDALLSQLRYTDKTTLEGFIQPACWRNKK